MMRATKGIVGICLCHVLLLLCQWELVIHPPMQASASPVETRCVLRSRYEKLWQPVNELANKIVSILFKAATFAFQWIPGLQATYLRPEFASPEVAAPVVGAPAPHHHHHHPPHHHHHHPPPVVAKPAPAGYCYIKSHVPVDNAYFKYDYQD